MDKREQSLEKRKLKHNEVVEGNIELLRQFDQLKKESAQSLAVKAKVDLDVFKNKLKDDYVNKRSLSAKKHLKYAEDNMNSKIKRVTERHLSRTLSRYAPNFAWPKAITSVELKSPDLLTKFEPKSEEYFKILRELSEVDIELSQDDPKYPPSIKVRGGFGPNKESARLTLNDVINKNLKINTVEETYKKHRATIEKSAIHLGKKAVNLLQIGDLHPELQKLVGYLNWRTSYRQNQWHHTFEVATLAGILGFEMGLDPMISKKCGLLHDIGKALDYNVDGGHAVISADYADRYGVNKLICDTVLSHHNDLVLETPLSYVLKTADTLSGARPGARVNLEEGYQIRLSGIDAAVRSFNGISHVAMMNGGREVHIEVNYKNVKANSLKSLSEDIAAKISEDVAFPGEIKVVITRKYEAVSVA